MAAAATPGAENVSAGSGRFSLALFIAQLKILPRRSGRLVSARGEPRSRSWVRGAGARAAKGTRPRLSETGWKPDPGFCRAAAWVLSQRGWGRLGAGRWVPPLRVLPLAGTSSAAEHRSGLGAWRWARGAGRGRRRSQSEQRPVPTPRSRRRGPPSSSRSS